MLSIIQRDDVTWGVPLYYGLITSKLYIAHNYQYRNVLHEELNVHVDNNGMTQTKHVPMICYVNGIFYT